MTIPLDRDEELLKKLRQLPPDWRAEVEDFIDFLLRRQAEADRQTVRGAMGVSAPSFRKVWDNSEDADYDGL